MSAFGFGERGDRMKLRYEESRSGNRRRRAARDLLNAGERERHRHNNGPVALAVGRCQIGGKSRQTFTRLHSSLHTEGSPRGYESRKFLQDNHLVSGLLVRIRRDCVLLHPGRFGHVSTSFRQGRLYSSLSSMPDAEFRPRHGRGRLSF